MGNITAGSGRGPGYHEGEPRSALLPKDPPADDTRTLRFEPEREGLEAVMGPLEAKVMDAVWSTGETTVREVWETLGGEEQVAYTTIMTIFHRLFEKGYLARRSRGRAHLFRPRTSREEFQEGVLSRVLRGVLQQLRGGASIGLVNRLSAEERAQLQELLAKDEEAP